MKPLQRLSDVATAIARERSFTQRVPASNIVELDDLAENFNRLLDEIEAWQNQLQGENVSLAHQASHDSLTGLPNRSQFEPARSRAAREADQSQTGFAVMFIDCNHFKQINDERGHAAGDQVLISIAERLRNQLREEDLVARLGGDEFAVLLKPIQQDADALLIADKIVSSMNQPIDLPDGSSLKGSLSVGMASSRATPTPSMAWYTRPTSPCTRRSATGAATVWRARGDSELQLKGTRPCPELVAYLPFSCRVRRTPAERLPKHTQQPTECRADRRTQGKGLQVER